jgi:hypothetical protein
MEIEFMTHNVELATGNAHLLQVLLIVATDL